MAKNQELVSQEDVDLCENMTGGEEALVRDILSRVVDKWSLWALSELAHDGPLRFSRLLDRLAGVSQKSLTAALRRLERDGLVTRSVTVQVPIRVDYEATRLGLELIRHVDPSGPGPLATSPSSPEPARTMIETRPAAPFHPEPG
jgi:DNA-binding HxlR family transcriptional regulator